VISTAVALLTLYGEIFPRVRLDVAEMLLVNTTGGGTMLVSDRDTLVGMGGSPAGAIPVLSIAIRNRGRRDARIESLARRNGLSSEMFADAATQLPGDVKPGHSLTVVLGVKGGYSHGDIPLHGFFVVDGGDRVYPLRRRWLLTIENVLYRRALIRLRNRRKRKARQQLPP
jgi:hypothetical protein